MFSQNTRISDDPNEVRSYENQVLIQSRYAFDNRFDDACPSNPDRSVNFQCTQNNVGDRQVEQSTSLRMMPTTLNHVDERHLQSALMRQVPYMVGGGFEGKDTDMSRQLGNGSWGKYETKYYTPRTYLKECDTTVEDFIRGGISTRACYRNAKKKISPNSI